MFLRQRNLQKDVAEIEEFNEYFVSSFSVLVIPERSMTTKATNKHHQNSDRSEEKIQFSN